MNFDALFDDLEATFDRLQPRFNKLCECTPIGLERVDFGIDHFSGFVTNTAVWRLTMFTQSFRVAPGKSKTSGRKARETIETLTSNWIRIETDTERIQGKLLAVEGKLLIFREFCVPIAAIKTLELHAVDNPKR